ncbi:MAG: type III secretion system chaperone [Oscillatoria sp. PMC 1051.18]|nr:type III secretion system chaperone [Oscillatoria sp. PMC 1050.18]MEC5031710.1 type III secretion system chaperone [Oscillatoria sp. PMC 1051.18]
MKIEEITTTFNQIFPAKAVKTPTDDSWQVELDQVRLLAILSEDKSWLRLLLPIVPVREAQPFLEQLLEANFDLTQEVRYAFHQEVLWGVYQHNLASLTPEDLEAAIARLVSLKEKGLDEVFNLLVEKQILQIISAAKLQGQTLQDTIQNLERFYHEGMLGGMEQNPEERKRFLKAWRYQLERLWSEV